MTNQNRPRPFDILSQAIAYLLGGIFLYTADLTGTPALTTHILGGIFMAFAFFLGIASFFNGLKGLIAWVRSIDMALFLGLFLATLVRLIITAAKGPEELLWVVIAFLFLTLGAFLFHIFRLTINVAAKLGNRVAAAKILKVLSFLLSFFALLIVIMPSNIYGGPIFYLALSVVCLSISLLL